MPITLDLPPAIVKDILLLLAAAEANGCDEIWTEDLSDGQTYCGVKAVNPFK